MSQRPIFRFVTMFLTVLALRCEPAGEGSGDPAAQSWEGGGEQFGGGSTTSEGGEEGSCSQYPFEQVGSAQGAVERDLRSCLEPLELEAQRQGIAVPELHRAIWRRDCLYNVFVAYNQGGADEVQICVAYETYVAAQRQFEAWEQQAWEEGPRDERENVVP